VLAAAITLTTKAAASALPLRIEVEPAGLRLVNTTSVTARTVDSPVRALEIAGALDGARAALTAGTPAPAAIVDSIGPVRRVDVAVQVPLRVRGTIRFDGQPPRSFVSVVGGSAVEISGAGAVRALKLSVAVPDPASIVRPPGARRWLDLVRSGRLTTGRAATRLAVNRLLTAALAGQYRQFLANPDAHGVTTTSYRYEVALTARPPAAEKTADGRRWPVTVGIAVGLIAAAIAALVFWAHS
jgi:hypothetical protein